MNTNRFYSAFNVLKWYVEEKHECTIVNYTVRQRYNHCVIWVAPNENNITHFVCDKLSPTQFVIRWYGGDELEYEQLGSTSYDFVDVNTPPDVVTVDTD